MTILTVRSTQGRGTASTRSAAVEILLIITITWFTLWMGKWTFQCFPQLPTTQYKKEFVRELVFEVYILACLEDTWAHFPLYVSVLRGCWRSHSLSIQDLFVAEKIPNNKTIPTPFYCDHSHIKNTHNLIQNNTPKSPNWTPAKTLIKPGHISQTTKFLSSPESGGTSKI